MNTKKVTFLVEKNRWWYAEIEVPAHMSEEEIMGLVCDDDEDASRVWDEDLHEAKGELDITIVGIEENKEA